MNDPGAELAQRSEWERDRRMAWIARQSERADQVAEAERQAELQRAADRADEAAFAGFMARVRGEPVRTLEGILEQSRQAQDAPQRDLSAPLGSESNPVQFVDWVPLGLEAPRAQRSADEKVLAQARRMAADPYMRVMVTRFGRRRRLGREAVRGSLGPADQVDCHGCREVGATPEESLWIHADPDAHPGLAAEMDPPSLEHSARSYSPSGTGWPSQPVPMIFR